MAERVTEVILKSLTMAPLDGLRGYKPKTANHRITITGEDVSEIHDSIVENEGVSILRSVASRFCRYDNDPDNPEILIPEGWAARRYQYVMVVEIVTEISTTLYYIEGYTDSGDGVIAIPRNTARSLSIDKNMVFYVNSYTKGLRQSRVYDNKRYDTIAHIGSSINIVNHGYRPPGESSRRKSDERRQISSRTLARAVEKVGGPDEEDYKNGLNSLRTNTEDRVTIVTKKPTHISVRDQIGSDIVTTVTEAYINAREEDEMYSFMTETAGKKAQSRILSREDNRRNGFMQVINSTSGYGRDHGSFEWKDLLKICPDADKIINYVDEADSRVLASQSDDLHASSAEALAAARLFNELPAMIQTRLMDRVTFKAFYDFDANLHVFLVTGQHFMTEHTNQRSMLKTLEREVVENVLPAISGPQASDYLIEGEICLYGKSHLYVGVDETARRDKQYYFEHMTLASGLLSPCITDDEVDIYDNAEQLSYLVDGMVGAFDEVNINSKKIISGGDSRPRRSRASEPETIRHPMDDILDEDRKETNRRSSYDEVRI